MRNTLQLGIIGVIGLSVMLVAALTLTPAAFANKYKHHAVIIKIHQHTDQRQRTASEPCIFANCQQNSVNVAQTSHDNAASVNQTNAH